MKPGGGLELNRWVTFTSVAVIALFLLSGVLFTEGTEQTTAALQSWIVTRFGWLYIGAVAAFLLFAVYLFFSRWGDIRLGPDDSTPDFGYGSWFAMLFSAGMGIGLVFFSVAEPIAHFSDPPTMEGGSPAAATEAMRLTFFHWGVHAWAIYIIVGLALAYFSFRRGLPLSIRSAFHPLLGDRIHGAAGNAIDTLAIFGTMFGVATSLGLGVMQVNAGLNHVMGVTISTPVQIALICGITGVATTSVVLGLDRGIRRLSNFNMIVAAVLIAFVFLAGPTVFLLDAWIQNTGVYLSSLVRSTFRIDLWGDRQWQGDWTLFYWGWWISWSPFVGMFIARISRGRTIREFVGGVLLVPTALTTFWLTVFGDTALYQTLTAGADFSTATTEQMLFVMLEGLPMSTLFSVLAIVVIAVFFVTSSDSGSLVIDMLASGGNPDPPKVQRVFWALTEGAVAIVLLLAGGLTALQTAAIATGLPFAVVVLLMCVSLWMGLQEERGPGLSPGVDTASPQQDRRSP